MRFSPLNRIIQNNYFPSFDFVFNRFSRLFFELFNSFSDTDSSSRSSKILTGGRLCPLNSDPSHKQLFSCMSEKGWSLLSLGDDVGMKKSTSGRLAGFWFAAWFAPIRFIGEYWFGIGLILLRLSLGWTTRNLENQFKNILRLFSFLNLYFDVNSTQIFSSKYSKYRMLIPNYPFSTK